MPRPFFFVDPTENFLKIQFVVVRVSRIHKKIGPGHYAPRCCRLCLQLRPATPLLNFLDQCMPVVSIGQASEYRNDKQCSQLPCRLLYHTSPSLERLISICKLYSWSNSTSFQSRMWYATTHSTGNLGKSPTFLHLAWSRSVQRQQTNSLFNLLTLLGYRH